MDNRAELVRLIATGAPEREIRDFFIENGFEAIEIDDLFRACDIYFPRKPKDHSGISDERRRELQALSTSDYMTPPPMGDSLTL